MATKLYKITVTTGAQSNAGTDANVSIRINGTADQSPVIPLTGGSFETNDVDIFEESLQDLGNLLSIDIGHDNTGASPGWWLDRVTIQDTTTQAEWLF